MPASSLLMLFHSCSTNKMPPELFCYILRVRPSSAEIQETFFACFLGKWGLQKGQLVK